MIYNNCVSIITIIQSYSLQELVKKKGKTLQSYRLSGAVFAAVSLCSIQSVGLVTEQFEYNNAQRTYINASLDFFLPIPGVEEKDLGLFCALKRITSLRFWAHSCSYPWAILLCKDNPYTWQAWHIKIRIKQHDIIKHHTYVSRWKRGKNYVSGAELWTSDMHSLITDTMAIISSSSAAHLLCIKMIRLLIVVWILAISRSRACKTCSMGDICVILAAWGPLHFHAATRGDGGG